MEKEKVLEENNQYIAKKSRYYGNYTCLRYLNLKHFADQLSPAAGILEKCNVNFYTT